MGTAVGGVLGRCAGEVMGRRIGRQVVDAHFITDPSGARNTDLFLQEELQGDVINVCKFGGALGGGIGGASGGVLFTDLPD